MTRRGDVTALLLAGGRGTRMQGRDKGLLPFAGTTLVGHLLARIRPHVGDVLISANRNLERYRSYGCPVLPDDLPDFAGPLAGVLAGLRAANSPYLLTLPCDGPNLDDDLVGRLALAMQTVHEVAVAHDGVRPQPTYALLKTDLADALEAALAAGTRGLIEWYSTRRLVTVDFADRPRLFVNLNRPEDYEALSANH